MGETCKRPPLSPALSSKGGEGDRVRAAVTQTQWQYGALRRPRRVQRPNKACSSLRVSAPANAACDLALGGKDTAHEVAIGLVALQDRLAGRHSPFNLNPAGVLDIVHRRADFFEINFALAQ
jgi:hypothetical protein